MKHDYVHELETAVAKVWGETKELPGLDRVPRETLKKITQTISEMDKRVILALTNGKAA